MEIRLGDYDPLPLYNIKAVVNMTGISPSTLRAWERRYQVCSPQRSESGYRLYSDRDVAVIRWLKSQVDAGMAISQATAWLETMVSEAGSDRVVVLPGRGQQAARSGGQPSRPPAYGDHAALQQLLLQAFMAYDEAAADGVLSEAFALYAVEEVGDRLIGPALVEIGRRWEMGEVSITTEHFAAGHVRQRLHGLMRAAPLATGSAPIWVGCAPGELHEVGVLLLALYLRRAGFGVRYLGQSVDAADLVADAGRLGPALVLLSASTEAALSGLNEVAERMAQLQPAYPLCGFGGRLFAARPELSATIPATFLGSEGLPAVEKVRQLLQARPEPGRTLAESDQ